MPLDLPTIRAKFPGLKRNAIFLDNPAGTQIAQNSLDRITAYLVDTNANHDGAFATSRASDALIDESRQAVADFLNAARPEEIIFGPNMTSLTLHLSRSIARMLDPGDTVVVTHLDHDANIAPWTLVADDRGCQVEWVDFDVEDGTLRMDSFEAALEKEPKLVALGYASNALGTINPVKKMARMAHDAGALVFVDAVQYAPHCPIDVRDIDVDFLACSSYKFYGPHVGILYGRYDLLDELFAYKVRPASDHLPGKFETGTQNMEGIAGVLGALEYLEWVGTEFGGDYKSRYEEKYSGRKKRLKQAMAAIRAYEYDLSRKTLETLQGIPGLHIYGLDDLRRVEERVPTIAVNLEGLHPHRVAQLLDEKNIYVWDGNYYALSVTQRLGVEDSGGMVRIGGVHYNTLDEVDRLGQALLEISRG
ncbi:MAG: cysteine desulfurase-like protein [Anaerolineales bacterium]|jgi:cysteine desulfurase family protein (TIGR01976 family)